MMSKSKDFVLKNPEEFGKYYNTQPIQIPFRTPKMRETLWRLGNEYWTFYFFHNGVWTAITLKQGFICDLASIPWIAQPLLKKGKDGVHRGGVVPHDFWYTLPKIKVDGEIVALIKSKDCYYYCHSFIGGKWVASDITITKNQSDVYMFSITESIRHAYIKPRIVWAIMLAFKTWIAHRAWKKESNKKELNPIFCDKKIYE